jgi:hypothetical protein
MVNLIIRRSLLRGYAVIAGTPPRSAASGGG